MVPSKCMSNIETISGESVRAVFNDSGEIVSVKTDADVVVFPRPLHNMILKLIPALQNQGVAVVCEVDDDFQALSPQHVLYERFNPKFNDVFNWQVAKRACQMADWVTVSSDALAERYGQHGRVSVIPNYVPDEYIDIGRSTSAKGVNVTWGGIVGSHPRDLTVVGNAIERLSNEFEFVFRHIGGGDANAFLGASQSLSEGMVDLDDWPKRIAESYIGIAPLESSKFNDSKSWLKPLEYMALGVPNVSSPSPEYKKLGGIIAKRPRDWYREVGKLLSDPEHYAQTRMRGFDTASKNVISKHYHKWEEAWSNAIRNRR